jgi:transcriptional regulator with XRE-family HTH domain
VVDRAAELGAFLRHCRGRLRPENVGLIPAGRRRTPGLRREEVAAVAGIGVSWYARLEQGRALGVSTAVIDALARVLLLDRAEWGHLRQLAGLSPPADEASPGDLSVSRLLGALGPNPALAMDRRWNIIGWNDAHRRLLIDLEPVPESERNLLRLVFTHPGVRDLMADWDTEAPTLLAEYRADLTPDWDDAQHLALVEELSRQEPSFQRWWNEHQVATFRPRVRRFPRFDGTTFQFEHHRLQLVAAPSVRIIAYLSPNDETG